MDFAGEASILCKAIKLSFKYRNQYFAATHFLISCLMLSEDIKLGLRYPLNQVLACNTA